MKGRIVKGNIVNGGSYTYEACESCSLGQKTCTTCGGDGLTSGGKSYCTSCNKLGYMDPTGHMAYCATGISIDKKCTSCGKSTLHGRDLYLCDYCSFSVFLFNCSNCGQYSTEVNNIGFHSACGSCGGNGYMILSVKCNKCNGTGWISCTTCGGDGKINVWHNCESHDISNFHYYCTSSPNHGNKVNQYH